MDQNNINPDPMSRPMQPAEVKPSAPTTPAPSVASATQTTPINKKKKWPIIAIIICLFIAVGCGVAAILLTINQNKGDAVSYAIAKIMNGEIPDNISASGNITVETLEQSSPISKISINLKSDIMTRSLINNSSANVSIFSKSGAESNFEFNEIYAANGDLYLKVTDAADAIQSVIDEFSNTVVEYESTDNTDDAEIVDETDEVEIINNASESFASIIPTIFEQIDDEWIKIPLDSVDEDTISSVSPESTKCLISLANDAKNNSNSILEIYKNNQFIASTTENISIESKRFPIHQIIINEQNLTNFINNMQNNEAIKNLYSCFGYENSAIDTEKLISEIKKLPTLYVEISDNNDFARLYMNTEIEETKITVDLNFDYPSNINVSEPIEYQNLEDIFQAIFSDMYMTENANQ